jgi:glycerol-3-phosphate acyltransferase PlsX
MNSGDFGPRVTFPAALRALKDHPRLHLRLVGDGGELERSLTSNAPVDAARISITHAASALSPEAGPRDVLRGDGASSLHRCIDLLAAAEVDGVVSAGPTAALMALGRRRISMLPGFSRPALCSAMPAESGLCYMLDLGANVDADPESLHEFARLGIALLKALEECDQPRVALLSNGSEPGKGNLAIREAAQRMSQDPGIDYIGYIEGDGLYRGDAELIVCDGLLGNVALKTAEGTARLAALKIVQRFSRHWWLKLVSTAAAPALRELRDSLSAERHGGAFLLGLRGVVVKSHGGAGEAGFCAALDQAARCIENDMVPRLAQHLDDQEMLKE